MSSQFDRFIDRRGTDSVKWSRYPEDVLPMWVADMDFASPEPVIAALRERVEHGVFGYPTEPKELRPVIVERLQRLYGWRVSPEDLVFIPGVVCGLGLACHAIGEPGDGVLVQTPIYPPFLSVAGAAGRVMQTLALERDTAGRYSVDPEQFDKALDQGARLFLLCNPHNPVGRAFSRRELEGMAQACLRHDVVICSDEIHCDLIYPGVEHVPIASLAPEVADHIITLMAPSKTFNIPGLHFSLAIIPNVELRRRFQRAGQGLVPGIGIMGYAAALAAYRDGQPWLEECLAYLRGNRDYLAAFVGERLQGVGMVPPEATYLAWLDCRALALPEGPYEFFLQRARVAMNDGCAFGPGGEGFVRLNFGCCRAVLQEALERMSAALATRPYQPKCNSSELNPT